MHHSDDPRRLSLALTCYCDDSGSHDTAEIAVVGATLMNKPRFIEFNLDWEKILKEFRIDSVHMRDFMPYARYSTLGSEMKKALFTSVAKAINRKKTYSLSIAVPQADYRSFFSKSVCKELMGPYALAFFSAVILNRDAGRLRKYNNRISYLVDKGNSDHHEQLEAAHKVMLQLEKAQGERFTGPMATDIDDNNNALQAADVIAWSYHRRLESRKLEGDFLPLQSIFQKSQIIGLPDSAVNCPHIEFFCPKDGIAIWARLINNWINEKGDMPTWEQMAAADSLIAASLKNSTKR